MLPSGTKTFYLHHRTLAGRQFKIKLGRFEADLTAEQARGEAKRIRAAVALGQDPAAERRTARRQESERQAAATVEGLWQAFQEAHRGAWRPTTATSYEGWWRVHARPVLGRLKAHEVEGRDVRRMYAGIVKRAPATADQALRLTSSMYSWAVAQDDFPLITVNPCRAARRPQRQGPGAQKREREPEEGELERLVRAIEGDDPIKMFFMALLLTGAGNRSCSRRCGATSASRASARSG